MHLGRKSEPELANRNHPSAVQKAKTGKPAAEGPGRLRICLRVWVLLKLSGVMHLGVHHTLCWQHQSRKEKKSGSVLEPGREVPFSCYGLQCPSRTFY